MPRLFFALHPDKIVRHRLADLCQQIPNTRRIPLQNIHLTLHFIGQTDAVDCLVDNAKTIFCRPFKLTIDHFGFFNRAKVLWAGPKQVPYNLTLLAQNCALVSEKCSDSDQTDCFTPHVSLIRKISNKPEMLHFDPIHWDVHDF
jgi:2'-5' RNA ligase